jgi:hypothetical protein
MRATDPPIAANATALKTREHGERLIAHLHQVMHALLVMLEKEIELVRAGRLSEVARLEPDKAELARLYAADAGVVRANAAFLKREMPATVDKMRGWHEGFQVMLQNNLMVLATAHAVSEGIIRGVAGELARKAAPSTYGRSGQHNMPRRDQVQPVAVSRRMWYGRRRVLRRAPAADLIRGG